MNLDALFDPASIQTRSKPHKPCKVTQVIAALDEPYKSVAQSLVDTKFVQGGLPDIPLAAKFAEAGIQLSSTMLNRHRNNWCPCLPNERN
jgi:hypothetical protein